MSDAFASADWARAALKAKEDAKWVGIDELGRALAEGHILPGGEWRIELGTQALTPSFVALQRRPGLRWLGT